MYGLKNSLSIFFLMSYMGCSSIKGSSDCRNWTSLKEDSTTLPRYTKKGSDIHVFDPTNNVIVSLSKKNSLLMLTNRGSSFTSDSSNMSIMPHSSLAVKDHTGINQSLADIGGAAQVMMNEHWTLVFSPKGWKLVSILRNVYSPFRNYGTVQCDLNAQCTLDFTYKTDGEYHEVALTEDYDSVRDLRDGKMFSEEHQQWLAGVCGALQDPVLEQRAVNYKGLLRDQCGLSTNFLWPTENQRQELCTALKNRIVPAFKKLNARN